MPQAIQLVDAAFGAIVSISEDDWTAINERAGMILELRRGWQSPRFGLGIPGFPALAHDCALWRCGTFPLITRYPDELIRYADLVTRLLRDLGALRNMLQSNNTMPLPPQPVYTLARNYFAILAQGAAALSATTSTIADQIVKFSKDNLAVDGAVAQQTKGNPIQDSVSRAELAAGKVTGAWTAMSDDLAQVMSGQLPITSAMLLSLDIDSTLASWTNVRNEATAFTFIAPNLQQRLEFGWQMGIQTAGIRG